MNDENYNPSFTTPLGELEPMFRQWKSQQAPTDPGLNYDYRGAFQNEFMGGNTRDPVTGHWRDTYKEPNHPTFSVESQYAGAYPERAGTWQGDTYQKPSGNEWFDNYFGQGISPIDVLHSFSPPPPTPTPQASPTALPSPPTQPPWLSQKHEPSLGNIWPGMMASIGEAGSQLAGMSKEDKVKMAISLLVGREGEVPFPNKPGAMPYNTWQGMKPKGTGPNGGEIRVDNAGNHYEFLGTHESVGDTPSDHVIVKPLEPPSTFGGTLPKMSPEEAAAFDDMLKQKGIDPNNPYKSLPPSEIPFKEIPQDAPPPPKTDWGNLNDPKYYDRSMSGPLVGQQWADIYATPDVEFTVPPKKPNDPYLDPKYDPDLQIWFRTNYGKTGEPIDPTTGEPFKAPEGSMGFGKAKEDFLSGAGEELPPPPDTGWWDRWNWKPPPQ